MTRITPIDNSPNPSVSVLQVSPIKLYNQVCLQQILRDQTDPREAVSMMGESDLAWSTDVLPQTSLVPWLMGYWPALPGKLHLCPTLAILYL